MTAPQSNPAPRIRVGFDFLRNLGNFQNVHVKVEVEDCPREGETVHDAYDRIKTFCQSKLIEQTVEIESEIQSSADV